MAGSKKKARVWCDVRCDTHGIEQKANSKRWVKVSLPKHKRAKRSGCPACKKPKEKSCG